MESLVIDIGGTNARVALAVDGEVSDVEVHPTSDLSSLPNFLTEQVATRLSDGGSLALALPGPVRGSKGQRESFWWQETWHVSEQGLKDALHLEAVHLMNDFAAQALALPHLGPVDLQQIGENGEALPEGNRVVLGPGTGLGVAGLVPGGHGRFIPIVGEGGHVDLAPSTDEEVVIFMLLQERFGHVSPERVISGPGLEMLYQSLCALEDEPFEEVTAPEIADAARSGDSIAMYAISMMSTWLGAVAGDLALSFGATAGVYVSGGVVPALGDLFDGSAFRERFEAKGRFQFYTEAIPTWLVTRQHPGLLGLARALSS